MARKHKHGKKSVNQQVIEQVQFDRSAVRDWCLNWFEQLIDAGHNDEAECAFEWAEWCETAPANLFNQMCQQWQAWEAQQHVNASVQQVAMF